MALSNTMGAFLDGITVPDEKEEGKERGLRPGDLIDTDSD